MSLCMVVKKAPMLKNIFVVSAGVALVLVPVMAGMTALAESPVARKNQLHNFLAWVAVLR